MNSIVNSKLKTIFGEENITFDENSKLIYGKDLTQKYTPNPTCIVFPESQDQLLKLVSLANETCSKLVPSGGRTGYSGGAVARNGEIVVSFDKMNKVISFNEDDKQVTCQAGATTQSIQCFARKKNLMYPVDFASSGTSQIGGNIATNAGGIKVIQYGLTREWVCGLKVITGNGDLLELNRGLIKNASGYDLRHLFIGSEGTLGLIVEATLQLTEPTLNKKVFLLSIPSPQNFSKILGAFKEKVNLHACEFFSEEALQCVISEKGIQHPFLKKSPFYILIEYESNDQQDNLAEEAGAFCIEKNIVTDILVSTSIEQARKIWEYREDISMSLLKHYPYKYDISVLPSKISPFILEIKEKMKSCYPQIRTILFGHIGDGNLHLNLLKPEELSKSDFSSLCKEIDLHIYSLIQKYEGSISAEHGVGLLKKEFLHYSNQRSQINYMKEIKRIFDRNNIMNPGKIF